LLLPIQKSTQKLYRCRFRNQHESYATANSEICSHKLCHCRFWNRPKNFGAIDSEIGNQLCRCRFLKSIAMMESFWLYFFLMFTRSLPILQAERTPSSLSPSSARRRRWRTRKLARTILLCKLK
jgi:hypothetical protein